MMIPTMELPSVHSRATDRDGRDATPLYNPATWESEYNVLRYLRNMSHHELEDRYASIRRNMSALVARECDIIPIDCHHSSWYWYRKEHETRLELALRGRECSCIHLPVRPSRSVEFLSGEKALYRYGQSIHLRSMMDEGELRLTLASEYATNDGDEARQDQELKKSVLINGERTSMIHMRSGKRIVPIGDVTLSHDSFDYYVLCMSCEWDIGLFEAFRVDACVEIVNVDEFAARLDRWTKKHMKEWDMDYLPVQYFDPYDTPSSHYVDPGLYKDFRFAYQREFRFLWTSSSRKPRSPHVTVRLGSQADIMNYRDGDPIR